LLSEEIVIFIKAQPDASQRMCVRRRLLWSTWEEKKNERREWIISTWSFVMVHYSELWKSWLEENLLGSIIAPWLVEAVSLAAWLPESVFFSLLQG